MTLRTQSYGTHRQWQPIYHFISLPIISIALAIAIWLFVRGPSWQTGFQLILAVGVLFAAVANRYSTLRVQDRQIRFEQRIRMAGVLPPDLRARIHEVRARHLIGLRFASDAELPDLVRRCLAGELRTADDVKKEIREWQPDFLRA